MQCKTAKFTWSMFKKKWATNVSGVSLDLVLILWDIWDNLGQNLSESNKYSKSLGDIFVPLREISGDICIKYGPNLMFLRDKENSVLCREVYTYADMITTKSSQFQASRRYVYELMKNPLAMSLIIISMV